MENDGKLKEFLEKHRGIAKENNPKDGEGPKYKWFSPPGEKNSKVVMRILPKLDNQYAPGKIIYKHKNLHEGKGLTCFKTWGKECLICNTLKEFEGRLDLAQWYAKQNSVLNVNIHEMYKGNGDKVENMKDNQGNAITPEDVCILYGSPNNLFWIIEQQLDKNVGDVTHPTQGSVVTVKREKEYGSFDRSAARIVSPIHLDPKIMEKILSERIDFDKIWREPDDNYLIEARKLSKLLKDSIEARLMILKTEMAFVPPANSNIQKPTEVVKISASTTTTTTNKPSGSPDCFKKEFNKDFDKCIICPYEEDCKS